MTMWRVTVRPIENKQAWQTYAQQGIIAIGWPGRVDDDAPQVRRFRDIKQGDWVVAHVPAEYGGGDCMSLGVGRIVSGYHEVGKSELPAGDKWDGEFRRQYRVEWVFGRVSLRSVTDYYRGTVHRLTCLQERQVCQLFGIANTLGSASTLNGCTSRTEMSPKDEESKAPSGDRRILVNGKPGRLISREEAGRTVWYKVILDSEKEARSFVSPPAKIEPLHLSSNKTEVSSSKATHNGDSMGRTIPPALGSETPVVKCKSVSVEQLRKDLHCYYVEHGISVDAFHCSLRPQCEKAANHEDLWSGSEAHVGSRFGSPFSLVVVSLDRGDGSDDVLSRTDCIQHLDPLHLNPHMRGTFSTLAQVLPEVSQTEELWKHFAMTNAAKCCYRRKGMDAVPQALYDNCRDFTLGELNILCPDMVVTQGNSAKSALIRSSSPVNATLALEMVDKHMVGLPSHSRHRVAGEVVSKYIRFLNLDGRNIPWLHTCHPSTWQGGLWQKYQHDVLPLAAKLLRGLVEESSIP